MIFSRRFRLRWFSERGLITINMLSNKPEVDWEAELAVIVGRDCKDLSSDEEASACILGYTAANDISARIWQTDPELCGGQFNKSKGFDTFLPLGPAVVLNEAGFDPQSLDLSLTVNGVEKQRSNTSDMIHSVYEVLKFMSQGTTVRAGTVILTGTPEGVGWFREPREYLASGDIVEVTLEHVGTLRNIVE
eukprot:g3610.t1